MAKKGSTSKKKPVPEERKTGRDPAKRKGPKTEVQKMDSLMARATYEVRQEENALKKEAQAANEYHRTKGKSGGRNKAPKEEPDVKVWQANE